MTRRRAALLAAVLAVLLGATYLLTRRGSTAAALPELVPTTPTTPPAPVVPLLRTTMEAAPAAEIAPEPAPAAVEAPLAEVAPTATPAEPRSWAGGSRAVPARTPPLSPVEPAATGSAAEEPLPTWVRVGIVAAALVAFFAVSLIATKQV